MPVITLNALRDALGGTLPVYGRVVAQASAARTAGADVTLPRQVVVNLIDGQPDQPLDLAASAGTWGWSLALVDLQSLARIDRFVSVPEVPGPIDWGDLPEVDPETLDPLDPLPPSAAEILQAAEAAATSAAASATVASTAATAAALSSAPSPQDETSRPRFRRAPELDGDPVFDFSQVTAAGSITHPSMVEYADHPDPNKRWWLFYSTDHSTLHSDSGMFAATAPTPFGPFTDIGLVFRDDTGGIQHETPWVWWDERLGKFVSTYSIRNAIQSPVVPAAVGSQVTKWGYSTDLVHWTVGGLSADALSTDPGDGHTGYLRRWVISGREYAYSLFGGTIRGQRTMWRRRPTLDVTFQRDPRTMSNGKEMIRSMPGQSIAIVGTPTTDSAAASATNGPATADIGWAASHMDLFAFRGRPTALFRVGPRQSGGLVNDQTLVTGVLSTSMNALAEPPAELDTGTAASWEDADANFDALGNIFTYQGRCFFMYRSGGHQGAFGIGELY